MEGWGIKHLPSFFFTIIAEKANTEILSSGSALKNRLMPEIRSHIYFAGLLFLGALVYISPIGALGKIIFHNETYSHIPLIPIVSLVLLAIHGKSIFTGSVGKPSSGFAVCAGGLFVYGIAIVLREHLSRHAFRNPDVANDYLTLCIAAAVAWVIGSFITVYGPQAFKKARFALLFLLFTIPIPMFLLDGFVTFLQYASAEASDMVFKLSGASYHRSGLVFEFSNVAIQVAEQCSGIRSSLSLFILSIIMGYLFLRTVSSRIILAVAVLPITVIKNAFRITTITLLADKVDMRFLTNHWIHSSGGIPFFAVALTLFIPLVWILRKSEARKGAGTDFHVKPKNIE